MLKNQCNSVVARKPNSIYYGYLLHGSKFEIFSQLNDMAGIEATSPAAPNPTHLSRCLSGHSDNSIATKSFVSNGHSSFSQVDNAVDFRTSQSTCGNTGTQSDPFGALASRISHSNSNKRGHCVTLATKSDLSNGGTESLSTACSEESERDARRRARKQEKQELLGRGQIKLSISVTGDQLVVFVQEAYGLKSEWRSLCNAYVQAEICENDVPKSRPQTKVISNSNCPVFNERLSHCLRPGDERRRLLISVWHQDNHKRCSELLGCLSFGLRHLVAKCTRAPSGVHGWYYLLSAQVGHRKHLLASRKSGQTGCGHEDGNDDKENQQQFEYLSYKLKHRDAGYGFTVRGPHPIRVGRIKVGGPAEEAGLRKGDVILSINDQPITNQDMQQVAYVIRNSPSIVLIDVKRPKSLRLESNSSRTPSKSIVRPASDYDGSYLSSESKRLKLDALSDSLDSQISEKMEKFKSSLTEEKLNTSCNQSECFANECDSNQNMFCKQLLPGQSDADLSDSSTNHKLCNVCEDQPMSHSGPCEHVTCLTNQHEETDIKSKLTCDTKHTKWNPDMSDITQTSRQSLNTGRFVDSVSSFDQHLMGLSHLASYKDLAALSREQYSYSTLNIAQNSDLLQHHSFSNSCNESTRCDDVTGCSDDSVTSHKSPVDDSRVCDVTDFENLTALECSVASERSIQKDLCIRTFLNCEQTFVAQMQRGIQAYSRPLRICVTAQQKEVLFQNIEKLVALSRFNLTRFQTEMTSLQDEEVTIGSSHSHSELPIQDLGYAYKSTVEMLCAAYTQYIRGLSGAVHLLRDLLQQSSFVQIVQTQKASCDLDLLDFLQQPVVHFEFMRRGFQELLSHLDDNSTECGHVKDILGNFQSAYKTLVS